MYSLEKARIIIKGIDGVERGTMLKRKVQTVETYSPNHFRWTVRKVFNWLGDTEFMIELDELDGCVSFGHTITEAKKDLHEALYLWIRKHGEGMLPDVIQGAHLTILEPPMNKDEFIYINKQLKEIR